MRKPNVQLTRNEFVAASRTVTTSFETTPGATPADVEDDFASPQIKLDDDDIIRLANSLKITLPGLTQFHSGFDLVTRADESHVDFAKRKLSALTPPFIQTNPAHPLNDWHFINRIEVNKCDEMLAETAYFFDAENNRLVIRHAPIDVTEDNEVIAEKLIHIVTQRILMGLHLDKRHIQIEHVIPRIQGGRLYAISSNSRHIVLQIITDDHSPDKKSQRANKIFDPRTNTYDNSNYISVGVQPFLDDINCGRHVLAMATVAAKILAENRDKNADTLIVKDFTQFPQVGNSSKCITVSELKALLNEIDFPALKQILTATQKSLPSCGIQFLMWRISDRNPTCSPNAPEVIGHSL